MDYLDWNDGIAAHFFSEGKAGRRIHLYVTRDLISQIGQAKGVTSEGVEDFVRAVKTGPPWAMKQGLCNRALEAIQGWRSRGLVYSPDITYLALFIFLPRAAA